MKRKQWNRISSITALPYKSSFIAINGELYSVGGVAVLEKEESPASYWQRQIWRTPRYTEDSSASYSVESICNFNQYDAEKKDWYVHKLPLLMNARGRPRLVYLNHCIYAIGGNDDTWDWTNDTWVTDTWDVAETVEYYEIGTEQWKSISPLPPGIKCCSAIACQGSILIYGRYNSGRGEILVYDPSRNEWQEKFNEPNELTCQKSQPILFVHKDQCYRVAFQIIPKDDDKSSSSSKKRSKTKLKPVVNILELKTSESNTVSAVSLGEEIGQDLIPPNKLGAFRIEQDVFVTMNGIGYQTDIQIQEDQDTDVNISRWNKFPLDFEQSSNVVTYTWDLKNYFHLVADSFELQSGSKFVYTL